MLDWRDVAPSRNNGQLLRRMERLVIDEISMVRADILDSIDAKLRQSRSDDRPFGGVQLPGPTAMMRCLTAASDPLTQRCPGSFFAAITLAPTFNSNLSGTGS